MSKTTKHRFSSHKLELIKSTVLYLMVEGSFGNLPVKGVRGPRRKDGGLHQAVADFVTDNFGHPIGRGLVDNLKNQAIAKGAPTVVKAASSTVTSTVKVPNTKVAAEPSDKLKLRRLSAQPVQTVMVASQRGIVKSLKGYMSEAPLTPQQKGLLNSLYARFYKKSKNK